MEILEEEFNPTAHADFGTQFHEDNSHFFKTGFKIGHWYSPHRNFTIANALRVETVVPLTQSSTIPTQELLFMGGADTMRGFGGDELKPEGGTVSVLHNLELQLRLFKGFELAGFLDTGALTDSFKDLSPSTVRHSAGFGFRYLTPVGPIRLDYGFVLDPAKTVRFTFGYFF